MTAVPVVADRVMRARRESVCVLCGGVIRPGQQIARCPARIWHHAACYVRDGGHTHNSDGRCEPAATGGRTP